MATALDDLLTDTPPTSGVDHLLTDAPPQDSAFLTSQSPQLPAPEGPWTSALRSGLSHIIPAAGTALGAVGAGAVATPETVGLGTIPAALGGAAAGGYAGHELQKYLMGDEWYKENERQLQANAQTNPLSSGAGEIVPTLVSMAGGGGEVPKLLGIGERAVAAAGLKAGTAEANALAAKAVEEASSGMGAKAIALRSAESALGGARLGASATAQQDDPSIQSFADNVARNAVQFGPLGILPHADTLVKALGYALPQSAIATLSGAAYDAAVHGVPMDYSKIKDQGLADIIPFALFNAVAHGAGMAHNLLPSVQHEATTPSALDPVIDANDQAGNPQTAAALKDLKGSSEASQIIKDTTPPEPTETPPAAQEPPEPAKTPVEPPNAPEPVSGALEPHPEQSNATLPEPIAGEILQRQPEPTGETGGESERVEPEQQGPAPSEESPKATDSGAKPQDGGNATSVDHAKEVRLAHADVDAKRVMRGELPLEKVPQGTKELWNEEAVRRIANGEGQALLDSLAKSPREISPVEHFMLLHHEETLRRMGAEAERRLVDPNTPEDEREALGHQAEFADQENLKLDIASALAGSKLGAGLGARRFSINRDEVPTVARLIRERMKVDDPTYRTPLAPEVEAKVRKFHQTLVDQAEATKDLQEKGAQIAEKEHHEELVKEVQKEPKSKAPKKAPLSERAKAARERLKSEPPAATEPTIPRRRGRSGPVKKAAEATPKTGPQSPEEAKAHIYDAYMRHATGLNGDNGVQGAPVRISDIGKELPNMSVEELHKHLWEMAHEGLLHFDHYDDPRSLTPEDKKYAVDAGGHPKHLVIFPKEEPPPEAPEPKSATSTQPEPSNAPEPISEPSKAIQEERKEAAGELESLRDIKEAGEGDEETDARIAVLEKRLAEIDSGVAKTSFADFVRKKNETRLTPEALAKWTPEVYEAAERYNQAGDVKELSQLTPIQRGTVEKFHGQFTGLEPSRLFSASDLAGESPKEVTATHVSRAMDLLRKSPVGRKLLRSANVVQDWQRVLSHADNKGRDFTANEINTIKASQGFYDPVTGKSFVIRDNIMLKPDETPERGVVRVMMHERVGHDGMAFMRANDPKFEKLYHKLAGEIPAEELADIASRYGYDAVHERDRIIGEWFARKVESLKPGELPETGTDLWGWWKAIKDWIARVMGKASATDQGVRDLAAAIAHSDIALEPRLGRGEEIEPTYEGKGIRRVDPRNFATLEELHSVMPDTSGMTPEQRREVNARWHMERAQKRNAERSNKERRDILQEAQQEHQEALKALGDQLPAQMKPKRLQFSLPDKPKDTLSDYATIMADHLANGRDAKAEMIKEFGDKVEGSLPQIEQQARQILAEESSVKTPASIKAKLRQAQQDDPERTIGKHFAQELAKAHLREDVNLSREELNARVLKDLQEFVPSITAQEARDLRTGYGKTSFPSDDPVDVRMRELNRIDQLFSSIERAEKKLAPLKSGPQRDKASAEIREMQKKLNDAMAKHGVETQSPEQHLATRRDAIRTRLTNEIEDLDNIIAGKQKARTDQTPFDYEDPKNADIKAIKRHRDVLKKIVDSLPENVEASEKSKNRTALKAAQDAEKEWNRRANELDFSQRDEPTKERSAEVRAAREKAKDAKTRYEELRKSAAANEPATYFNEISRKVESAHERIAEIEKKLAKGELAPTKGKESATHPVLEEARARLKELNKELQKARNAAKVRPSDQQRRLDAFKKRTKAQIAEMRMKRVAGIYDRGKRSPALLAHDKESQELEVAKKKEKYAYEQDKDKARLAQRTKFRRTMDAVVHFSREFKLLHPTTIEKLGGAGLENILTRPVGTAVAQLMKGLPVLRDVQKKATYEGRASWRSELKGMQGTFNSAKDVFNKAFRGKSDIDWLNEDRHYSDEFKSYAGNLHSAIKEPVRQGIYSRSLQLELEAAHEAGLKPEDDPLMMQQLSARAYENANSDIFMGDNLLTKFFREGFARLRNNKQNPEMGKFVADVAEILLPILNVPANLFIRTSRLNPLIGLPETLIRLRKAAKNGDLANGAEKLSARDAELITKAFKYGLMGTALAAYAWNNPQNFGGISLSMRHPGGSDDKSLKAGDVKTPFGTINHYLAHGPVGTFLNVVADSRREYENFLKKHPREDGQAAVSAAMWSMLAPVQRLPFIDTVLRSFSDTKPLAQHAAEIARGSFLPADTDIAGHFDKDWKGQPIKRKATTPLQEIELGIPGLRQNLPLKKEPKAP